jgi:uncharacterized integral membrane protein
MKERAVEDPRGSSESAPTAADHASVGAAVAPTDVVSGSGGDGKGVGSERTRPHNPRGRRAGVDGTRHTRISGAWAAVFVGVILGIALIDFIVENTGSLRINFFSANGRMPVAVALLAAALAGAAVVLVVGVCRTAQLRLSLRRHRRQLSTGQATESEVDANVAEGAQP